MDEIKRFSCDQKALIRLYGVRRTNAIIADRLLWARLERAGKRPLLAKPPLPLVRAEVASARAGS